MSDFDVIVIGAGQAGLAAGHALARTDLSFTLLEAGERAGGSWSGFYDSLTLFSPARYCALPGLSFPGSRWSSTSGASRDERRAQARPGVVRPEGVAVPERLVAPPGQHR